MSRCADKETGWLQRRLRSNIFANSTWPQPQERRQQLLQVRSPSLISSSRAHPRTPIPLDRQSGVEKTNKLLDQGGLRPGRWGLVLPETHSHRRENCLSSDSLGVRLP